MEKEKKERRFGLFASLRAGWKSLLRRQMALASLALMVVVTVAGLFYLAGDWSSPRYDEGEDFFWQEPAPPAEPAPAEEAAAPEEAPAAPKPAAPAPAREETAKPAEPVAARPGPEEGTGEPGPEPKEPLQPVLAPGQAFHDLALPVLAQVSSPFGWRKHPVFADWRFHPGVDLAAPLGTEVKAVLPGTVAEVKDDAVLGKVVSIDHGEKRRSTYGHLEKVDVEVGQAVERGQAIGTVGQTGLAGEPHLHLELRLDKEAVDPVPYLPAVPGGAGTAVNGGH
ncbi:MAG TPA: M23 family metallopeptidase [Firmicutes bacterium]|nr:M23 family metallopeptidase [Bacillota bacterium]